MALPRSFALLDSEFGAFLYASIGEDRNGAPLSVVSALTRLDIDPWQEAIRLAGLRVEDAVSALAQTIDRLPDLRRERQDRRAAAAQLIALLPRGGSAASGVAERRTRHREIPVISGSRHRFFVMAISAALVGVIAHVIWRMLS